MSRYVGPRLRIIRRLGKLRGFTRKKPFRRVLRRGSRVAVFEAGQHGLAKVFKGRSYDSCQSDYLIRLKVKQRLRFNYGITEKQLVRYVRKAKKVKESTGQILLQLLEMRLDNVVFRLNMAPTIPAARQVINHGHIRVNQKKVNIASYICKPRDVISVAMKESSLKLVNQNLQEYYRRSNFYKSRLEKTLAFILVKLNIGKNMPDSLQMVQKGLVLINNRKITQPNFICKSKDILSILTDKGSRKVKLSDHFKKPFSKRA
jgi:small subunit ribosomal protein S4